MDIQAMDTTTYSEAVNAVRGVHLFMEQMVGYTTLTVAIWISEAGYLSRRGTLTVSEWPPRPPWLDVR